MRLSQFFLPTLKETPAEAELISHQLMLRAGMIRKIASGVYTWLPLGLRVLRRVEELVRQEMNGVGALELLMPAVQPAELWQETGRWEQFGPELLKLHDRHQREFCFGPTHEEVITSLLQKEIRSYRQLPVTLYQIQTKFRDEIRPRFGVIRAREFIMKDAYSFHMDILSLQLTYQHMYDAYIRIFKRAGLKVRAVQAITGSIGGSTSHEFQVLANSGEDILLYSDESEYAANIELAHLSQLKEGDPSPDGKGILRAARGIEVGHIFQLGDKYSRTMGANILDEKGHSYSIQMGCYGIGISRIVAAAIEQHYDKDGIIWPDPLAPFQIALISINAHKSERLRKETEKLYNQLQAAGLSVLYDDRDERPGVMFANIDLIGIPHQFILSERHLDKNTIEYKLRKTKETQILPLSDIVQTIIHTLSTQSF